MAMHSAYHVLNKMTEIFLFNGLFNHYTQILQTDYEILKAYHKQLQNFMPWSSVIVLAMLFAWHFRCKIK